MGYFPHLLDYQDFWAINSMLKEMCFISEACLDVLLFELWFVIGNLFTQKAVVILAVDSDAACSVFNGHSA